LFLIAEDLTKMQVDTNVSESDVGRAAEGQPATFTVDAYPGMPFHGVVAQVRERADHRAERRDVRRRHRRRQSEARAQARHDRERHRHDREARRRAPCAVRALRFKAGDARHEATVDDWDAPPAGGTAREEGFPDSTVYVLEDGEPKVVKVQIGIRDAQHAEVTGGDLKEGAQAIVGTKREQAAAPVGHATAPGSAGGRRF
jgi:HlyD family secretion protein